ncbi:hypothetical protein SEA_ARCHIS_9 [Gordonia phage Archis]|nr:hypothetical protein SEA_ARCHIS_9 [Gordonia phage Archis]
MTTRVVEVDGFRLGERVVVIDSMGPAGRHLVGDYGKVCRLFGGRMSFIQVDLTKAGRAFTFQPHCLEHVD